jgi:1,4-dihydroxy-2-naphthoyl-CoA hydrolase
MNPLVDFSRSYVRALTDLVASARQPDTLSGVGLLVDDGRMTQVWDLTVARESDGRVLAHFRCTQHLVAAD